MQYLKVDWLHDFLDEPICIYSEIDDERYELRKIEKFRNGHLGFASENIQTGTTFLSEAIFPENEEIALDTQFQICVIYQIEFEELWNIATLNNQL